MFKEVNNILRFLVEVVTLGLIIASGLRASGFILKISLSTVIPVIVVLFWSLYMAPMSPTRLPELARIIAEVVIFGGTTFLTLLYFGPKISFMYFVIVAINTILDHVLT